MGNTNESKLDFDDERDVMNVEEAADLLRWLEGKRQEVVQT